MEDKYLETILGDIKGAVSFAMMRYGQTKNTKLLSIMINNIDIYIKRMEESDKKSQSITEFCQTLRGMRDEMVDEIERSSKSDIAEGSC